MNRLRVLHLNAGNMMGGIESLLLTIASHGEATPEIDHQFALCFDDVLAARLRQSGEAVHLLPQVRLRHLPSIWQSRRQLKRLLESTTFDVVIAHSPWIELIFGGVVRERRLPLVFWMHGPYHGHWLQRLASLQRPDFVICNSEWTRSTLERFYPRVPNRVLFYPVSSPARLPDRAQTRATLGIRQEEIVIFIAARMERWKGHHNLLRAAADIKTFAAWRILIAGAPNTAAESAYRDDLHREASRLQLGDRTNYLGFRSDVPALMAACDIHCQPNQDPEPFGIVFIEALQAGLPVVTFALGGAQEILDENCGILVPPGNTQELTKALTRIIEDGAMRTRLGSAGPARARKLCDPARQMRSLSDTLQSAMERHRGAQE